MGYVYLIGEIGKEGIYKIGSTRAKDVNKRLKQLQTGNSSELFIKESYKTEHPFKLEKMLHNHFKSSSLIGDGLSCLKAIQRLLEGSVRKKKRLYHVSKTIHSILMLELYQ